MDSNVEQQKLPLDIGDFGAEDAGGLSSEVRVVLPDAGCERLGDHFGLAERRGCFFKAAGNGSPAILGVGISGLRRVLELHLLFNPAEARRQHRRVGEIGIDVRARNPVLDALGLPSSYDSNGDGSVVDSPAEACRCERIGQQSLV